MPKKLVKTASRDVVVKVPNMSISHKTWLAGIENARQEAKRRKVKLLVPDEGIIEDYSKP